MKNPPKEIFLQIPQTGQQLPDITWSEVRINQTDIRYVLAKDATPNDADLRPANNVLCLLPEYRMN